MPPTRSLSRRRAGPGSHTVDKQIITALLIVAAIVCFGMAFNAVYPAVVRSGDALVSMGRTTSDRFKTDITILQ